VAAFKILESGIKTLASYFHVSYAVESFLIPFNAINAQIWFARLVLILNFLKEKGINMMKKLTNVINDVDRKSLNCNHRSLINKF
jgi:hypothetical protein